MEITMQNLSLAFVFVLGIGLYSQYGKFFGGEGERLWSDDGFLIVDVDFVSSCCEGVHFSGG
jgi:hypothetical protein